MFSKVTFSERFITCQERNFKTNPSRIYVFQSEQNWWRYITFFVRPLSEHLIRAMHALELRISLALFTHLCIVITQPHSCYVVTLSLRFCKANQVTLTPLSSVAVASDAVVWFGPVLGRKSLNLELDFRSGSGKCPDLKPGSSPVQQFWTEPLPYLGMVQVILHCRTWFQVWFKQFLNFEPDFGQVCQGSGSNFGSGPNCSITRACGSAHSGFGQL